MAEECELCGDAAEWLDDHHISYDPERTVRVCRSCHSDIHHTNKHSELKPETGDLTDFYSRDEIHVDESKIPSRSGWTIQVKYIPCTDGHCGNCPHGPYYYYYRRRGDTVHTQYGGRVTEDMLANQSELSQFLDQATA